MAMQIKLSLLSDYQCLDMEALEAWKKIKRNYISDDITRIFQKNLSIAVMHVKVLFCVLATELKYIFAVIKNQFMM